MFDTRQQFGSPIHQADSCAFSVNQTCKLFAAYRGNLRSPRRESSQRSGTQVTGNLGLNG